jgi:triacylglycerol lipase
MPLSSQAPVLDNAKVLGQAAAMAYQTAAACERWAVSQGFSPGTLECFDADDTQGFIVQNDTDLVVAFRGTEPKRPMDWLSDGRVIHAPWAHRVGKVHTGFYHALEVVWRSGQEVLPKRLANRGNRRVWITGHSLGGALAELCAARASFDPRITAVPIEAVYTFGQPRVGDDEFAHLLHDKMGVSVFRFVNDRDIVPRVPFFGMGYRHFGAQIFFDEAGKATNTDSSVETMKAALEFLRGALTAESLQQVGRLVVDVFKGEFHGLSLDSLEQALRKRFDDILKSGVEKVTDHDMHKSYLARLKAPFPV